MDSPDPFSQRLASWQARLDPDPDLKRHILQRVAWEAEAEATPWHRRTFSPETSWRAWVGAGLAACLLLILGSAGGFFFADRSTDAALELQQQAYRLLIDPVSRVEATEAASRLSVEEAASPNLVSMLAWMQDRFELSREQFLELVQLHREYDVQFTELYRELSAVRAAYAGFEARREADEMVDFMALYDLLERRRTLEADAQTVSAKLVQQVLQILRPGQREAYLAALAGTEVHHDA